MLHGSDPVTLARLSYLILSSCWTDSTFMALLLRLGCEQDRMISPISSFRKTINTLVPVSGFPGFAYLPASYSGPYCSYPVTKYTRY